MMTMRIHHLLRFTTVLLGACSFLESNNASKILVIEKQQQQDVVVENNSNDLIIRIRTNTSNSHKISPYLVGLHQVYTNTPDSVFAANTEFSNWVKKSGVSTSRFPGGTVVKYWDWENPTGQPWIDRMDPAFDASLNPPESTWQSLDEFLDFCNTTGIRRPTLGVNSLHGTVYNQEAEYIQKAVRMVQHVKDRGFGGAFYYIGNEEAFKHGGVASYAQVFARYAKAMKAVDPSIRIFWNFNNPNRNNMLEFLANDDGTADGMETHGKWPFGGTPSGMQPASFEEWTNEVPLRDHKNGNRARGGRAWRFAANTYRNLARVAGRDDLLIANNEYGFGKSQFMQGFDNDRYAMGLLTTELLMELFIGGWDLSCFWDLTRGTTTGLLDKQNGHRLNPFHYGMDLLADCQGGTYLHTITTGLPNVHGFAASKNGEILVYLLNKSGSSQSIRLMLDSGRQTIQSFRTQIMTNSSDGYGELQNLTAESFEDFGRQLLSIMLPNLSFTQIVLITGGAP